VTTTKPETIRSTYSDDQLRDALITATELRERIFIRGTVGADGAYGSQHWSEDQINDLHTILHVLDSMTEDSSATDVSSEPSHSPWQRAESIDDIRPGDEIKVETPGFIGFYNTPVERVGHDTKVIIFTTGDYFHWDDDFVVSRIPAPIVHPDPTAHPVIMEQGGKGWTWNAQYEMYHQPHSSEYRFPEGFTEWSPAQIVSDEPAQADHRG
jgi:hypothetical protein